jgi:eukaryotic-like serine/threonine-protein kinase
LTIPDRWARIDFLFGEALDRPPQERLAYLASATEGDPELFEEVRSLLEREAAAEALIGDSVTGFVPELLASFASGDPSTEATSAEEMAGRRVGPYRLLSELGRGGMGTVYLAERADGEFEKRVALKLVKRGMDTDELLGRFRFERRILASLEHPNIARLYDGGAADDGRPYLVMELVEGERITDYCDARALGVEERLALFGSVCAAVQHAHQHLVIHRDLKPSNILVAPDGIPKLLDFGIAKLLEEEGDDTPRTRTGMRVLTPEYAAPEQLRGEPVTTATDAYALGAVLYELLVGRGPFVEPGKGSFRGRGGASELETRGNGRTPIRPSAAVARWTGGRDRDGPARGIAPDPEAVARARGTTPDRLRRLLRGDLDTVVLKALEEDPARRYQSPQQLLEDLQRYVAGRPVVARPATFAYQAAKFVRRHRAALVTSALVLVSLLGGLGASLWQAGEAAAARDQAERERAIAEDERDAAEEVASFLEGMFAASDPFAAGPERTDTLRISTFLERGAERVGVEFKDRPATRARMLGVLGRTYRSLGTYERAEALLVEAVETSRAAYGNEHLELAVALNALANLYLDLQRPTDAEAAHREALSIRRSILGSGHMGTVESLNNLAAALQDGGRLDEAEALYDEVLAFHRQLDPPDSARYADALNARMVLAFRKDDMTAALSLAREILAIDRALYGEEHPRVARGLNNLAQVLSRTGAHDEAEPLLRRSLALNREILGDGHPNVAAGALNLAGILMQLGRGEEAEPLYIEAIETNRRILGERHPAVATSMSNYADLLDSRGQHSHAEALFRGALEINRGAFGPKHRAVGIVSARLAKSLCRQGRVEEGVTVHRQALAVLRATLPEGHSMITSIEADEAACAAEGP